MKTLFSVLCFFSLMITACSPTKKEKYSSIQPVNFLSVMVTDSFWKPKMELNEKVTIPYGFQMCRETGRIDNFSIAAQLKPGEFCSRFPFDDSDVYKIIEGASYALSGNQDKKMEEFLDSLISLIGAAQEEDGYLHTWRTIDPYREVPEWWGNRERWSNIQNGHELYNLGHLYEAAVAHYQVTGKRSLLDVAMKSAHLITNTFGPGKLIAVPGHEEIEIGLAKLYQVTGDTTLLHLAEFFVEKRGMAEERPIWGEYHQDHLPVMKQMEAKGHAVRAGYLYSAMAEIAILTGDTSYLLPLKAIWEDIISRKLYITGGVGARRSGEAFGEPFELPNMEAYNETCASIAMVLWNFRMFRLTGHSKYIDFLERTLYNGLISGISKTGDRFFYPNPLESDGKTVFNYGSATRQPWFDCACCPSNVARFMPQIPGFIYAVQGDKIYINLFIGNETLIELPGNKIKMSINTAYPYSGEIGIRISPEFSGKFPVAIRIPDWANGKILNNSLYQFVDIKDEPVRITVNGKSRDFKTENGYAVLVENWEGQNEIGITFPIQALRVESDQQVVENRGKMALQYGPIVYCAEGMDQSVPLDQIFLNKFSRLVPVKGDGVFQNDYLVEAFQSEGPTNPSVFIPYYTWSNRGADPMKVWFSAGMEE